MTYCIKEDLKNVVKVLCSMKGLKVLENKDYTELTSVRVVRLKEYVDELIDLKAKQVHVHSIEPVIEFGRVVFTIRHWYE